jgi:8-oxo-dGTP diphosphatase
MICEIYELNKLKDHKFVVNITKYKNKWLLCRHRERDTWETAGGHIEIGETPLEAAKRELYEETGAIEFDIRHIFDYWAGDEGKGASGAVFYVEVKELGALPESEMAEVRCFEELPDNLTYKEIVPKLFQYLDSNFKELL